ncbi:MAG: glycosyltransferase family 4 protein [Gemmataceae bacterium]
MRIAYITAGAAGMYCGSCMHDNTLVAELTAQGHDALLVPTYTPIRTDEKDVSQSRVFFGGINVYLQQKSRLFRRTPWFLDRLLDFRPLLRWVSRFAVKTQAQELGELTISMLKGEHGFQRKEIDKLSAWLKDDIRPQIINLTNVLLSGMIEPLRQALGVPVVATLQGDDIFLESLPADCRAEAIALIRQNCANAAGFMATSRSYADFMAPYLGLPRHKIAVIYPGLKLKGHAPRGADRNGAPFTIGYFARICPEKGLHQLVDAFIELKRLGPLPCRLRVAGWLGENNKDYFEEQKEKLRLRGLLEDFEHFECPDHVSKVRFLQSLDVLSVPTVYHEPKGLYVLEAWANGVPVVQPRHGSFPELVEASGGGLLVEPGDPKALATALRDLMNQPERARDLGRRGHDAVGRRFNATVMGRETVAWYAGFLRTEQP